MWRKDSQIDGYIGDAFIRAGQSISLVLDLFSHLVEVDELSTLAMEKLGPFGRTTVEQLENKRSTRDYTRASRQEIPFFISYLAHYYYTHMLEPYIKIVSSLSDEVLEHTRLAGALTTDDSDLWQVDLNTRADLRKGVLQRVHQRYQPFHARISRRHFNLLFSIYLFYFNMTNFCYSFLNIFYLKIINLIRLIYIDSYLMTIRLNKTKFIFGLRKLKIYIYIF